MKKLNLFKLEDREDAKELSKRKFTFTPTFIKQLQQRVAMFDRGGDQEQYAIVIGSHFASATFIEHQDEVQDEWRYKVMGRSFAWQCPISGEFYVDDKNNFSRLTPSECWGLPKNIKQLVLMSK